MVSLSIILILWTLCQHKCRRGDLHWCQIPKMHAAWHKKVQCIRWYWNHMHGWCNKAHCGLHGPFFWPLGCVATSIYLLSLSCRDIKAQDLKTRCPGFKRGWWNGCGMPRATGAIQVISRSSLRNGRRRSPKRNGWWARQRSSSQRGPRRRSQRRPHWTSQREPRPRRRSRGPKSRRSQTTNESFRFENYSKHWNQWNQNLMRRKKKNHVACVLADHCTVACGVRHISIHLAFWPWSWDDDDHWLLRLCITNWMNFLTAETELPTSPECWTAG